MFLVEKCGGQEKNVFDSMLQQILKMSQYRQLTPKSPIKLASKSFKHNKSVINTPPYASGTESKSCEKVTTVSNNSYCEYDIGSPDFHLEGSKQLQMSQELGEMKSKLAKEEQKNYIYEQFFKKVERIIYSQNSQHFDGPEIKNYDKLELHLADMAKRIEKGSHYAKLEAVPVIYRKSNTITTRLVTRK